MDLRSFLSRFEPVVRVVLTRVKGSSPREVGTEMFVARDGIYGTIGGGQLEYVAMDRARQMLAQGVYTDTLDVPLGPEIGQCCGGRVEMALTVLDGAEREDAILRDDQRTASQPHVYIHGAGHVGRALADLFQHLPVRTILVDNRAEELGLSAAAVEKRLTPLPEAEVVAAPAGSAFIVLTHDHALDFLLTAEALKRGDAAYVGMIGSATKRVKLRNFCRDACDGLSLEGLTCPIGAGGTRDRRPAVIAAFVVAEVMALLTAETGAEPPSGADVYTSAVTKPA